MWESCFLWCGQGSPRNKERVGVPWRDFPSPRLCVTRMTTYLTTQVPTALRESSRRLEAAGVDLAVEPNPPEAHVEGRKALSKHCPSRKDQTQDPGKLQIWYEAMFQMGLVPGSREFSTSKGLAVACSSKKQETDSLHHIVKGFSQYC